MEGIEERAETPEATPPSETVSDQADGATSEAKEPESPKEGE